MSTLLGRTSGQPYDKDCYLVRTPSHIMLATGTDLAYSQRKMTTRKMRKTTRKTQTSSTWVDFVQGGLARFTPLLTGSIFSSSL